MTITKDDIDSQQRKRSSIDMKSNLQSEYTIGSNDFILVDEVDERIKTNVKEKLQLISPCIISSSKTVFTYKNITKRLPILQWLPKYSAEDALGDLLAGITVGLTVIPQSMAYSSLAGLPPEFGLYGSFVGCLMYVFLGTCKDVPMGPTAIVSLMTYNTLHGLGPIYGTLLCFLSGVIQLLMGIVGLGFLIDFISGPVSSGFTSAVAILIIASQIKDLIGVKGGGSTLVDMVISMSKDIENYSLGDTMIGVTCIIIILLLRGLALFRIGSENVKEQTPLQKMLNRSMWLIGTFRNSIVVIVCSYISYLYIHNLGHDVESQLLPSVPFKVIGKIPSGMPSIDFPQFSIQNGATTIGFFEMVSKMGSGVIVLPLIALLENISVCKTFANGKTIDATQELVAIGLCNIGNSFVHGLPGSGSFSRSAVNNASGVRTPMGSLYTGVLVIVALMFFTPYFYYIPKSVLAAIIIAAVVFMVEVRVVRPIYRSKKSDLIPGLATFFACLVLPLEIGVLIGIGLNLVSILYHAARPKILIEVHKTRDGISYLMVTPDRCLVFPSVDYVRNLVVKHSLKRDLPVVIDCSHIYGADFTAAKVIEILTKDFSKRGQQLFFYNLKPSVVAVFEGVQPKDFITYYQRHELDFLLKKRTNTSSPSEVFPV
ncbi:sodium-independent sulfate anion transporter-like isoform X1 [Daktulosphaira vitifoliae]|uniref:sodium-independent sulfate anion transporter-like isoform X1 n=1 Tax=Daktulosphaira vitifoliae TaxID=58002 RepID=UPI0021AA3E13|nr:sodium-independent sulfate anion transporter-like isoform X1 [Daktulosphaira vitifoliae]XP_050540923.1 sodium-independent sulfate anion transporter-like isoform X1 [Daktulosphaira vitifoliae]